MDSHAPYQLVHHQSSSEESFPTCYFLPLIPNGAKHEALEISSEQKDDVVSRA